MGNQPRKALKHQFWLGIIECCGFISTMNIMFYHIRIALSRFCICFLPDNIPSSFSI